MILLGLGQAVLFGWLADRRREGVEVGWAHAACTGHRLVGLVGLLGFAVYHARHPGGRTVQGWDAELVPVAPYHLQLAAPFFWSQLVASILVARCREASWPVRLAPILLGVGTLVWLGWLAR